MSRKHLKHIFGACLFCLFGCLFFFDFGVKYNSTKSLPYHLFISTSLGQLKKGKIIAFQHPEIKSLVGKIVTGLPGETIQIKNNRVFVGGIDCGLIKHVSSSGKEYHPIQEGFIPNGFVFVSATHPDSFDSRYIEFGLIDQNWITGELWPLF